MPSWRLLMGCLWCGAAAGLVELGVVLVRMYGFQHGLSRRSPHLFWMAPVSTIVLFVIAAFPAAWLIGKVPRIGRAGSWLTVGSLAVLSPLLAIPGLTGPSCGMLAIGVAAWSVPAIRARGPALGLWIRWTLPVLLAIPAVVLGVVIACETINLEPITGTLPPDAPNVVMIVMDTVREDATSLSEQKRGRDTTPHLRALASRGARFDHAISTSSWTLPSHASMFTGRWVRELAVGTDRPLDNRFPTVAEYFSKHGYATAGFVANATFCGREYGIGRGFSHYEDVLISPAEILRGSAMGYWVARKLGGVLDHAYQAAGREPRHFLAVETGRKDAARINRDAMRWISSQAGRPFFAFMNYLDAHEPYLAPDARGPRYGPRPRSLADYRMLRDWLPPEGSPPRSQREVTLAEDSYDDGIASLDEHLGDLFDAIDRLGQLQNTVVIVTSDHGEHFGEHSRDGQPLFGHGASLYQPEIHVPLLIVAPRLIEPGQVVSELVSLRDLAATMVKLAGIDEGSPFPGIPLIEPEGSSEPRPTNLPATRSPFLAALGLYSPMPAETRYRLPAVGLRRAIFLDGLVYHLHGRVDEELYDLRDDPEELNNLAPVTDRATLDRYRDLLNTLAPPAALGIGEDE